jgi:hypothetical protein
MDASTMVHDVHKGTPKIAILRVHQTWLILCQSKATGTPPFATTSLVLYQLAFIDQPAGNVSSH